MLIKLNETRLSICDIQISLLNTEVQLVQYPTVVTLLVITILVNKATPIIDCCYQAPDSYVTHTDTQKDKQKKISDRCVCVYVCVAQRGWGCCMELQQIAKDKKGFGMSLLRAYDPMGDERRRR